MPEHNFLQVVLLMAVAVVCVAGFRRLNLPAILAYLVAGMVAGPEILSLYDNAQDMHLLAEIGIVFLLFSLGLEFSLPKLLAMRNLVFGAGAAQMCFTTLLFSALAWLLGLPVSTAVIVGGMLALSSTAIVIKQINELGILNHQRSQIAISVLLFQDLAVVPFLIVIPLLSTNTDVGLGQVLGLALLKGIVVVAFLLSVGKWVLPWVFREVARTRTDELFVLTTILIALLAGGLTYVFGLSMALGAFLAGMMLGESQYKYQLEADIRPFRDILMGLFFVTVGMQLDLKVLTDNFVFIVFGVVVIMLIKVLLMRASAWLAGCKPNHAWSASIQLCQVGEFSFVIAALATAHGVLSDSQSSILISMGVLSMIITPYLIGKSADLANYMTRRSPAQLPSEEHEPYSGIANHIVIAGFGRVGQSVAKLLKTENIPFVVIDSDPVRVYESRNAGEPIIFGDCRNKDILHSANVNGARLLLITFDYPGEAIRVMSATHQVNPKLDVMVRTKRDYELESLYNAGAAQVVPELQEGNLMLITQVLHYSGVPMSRILKRVRQERKGRYDHLHGFYPGETTEITYNTQDKLEFVRAVALGSHAACIGKALHELKLNTMRVTVKGLRRNGKQINRPAHSMVLAAGDILIVIGKPGRVEQAERYLLDGG